MKTIIFLIISLFLTSSGIWYAYSSSFNLGNFLVWALSIISWCYTFFHLQIDSWTQSGLGFVCKILACIGCILFACILSVILWGQFINKPSGKEAYLFVLGCAVQGEDPSSVLKARLDAAYEYYLMHSDMVIVVTGGQMPAEHVPEALVMHRYLVEIGVPEDKILIEDESTSTEENFSFSKQLLQENGYKITADTPIVYVTNGFHCMRSGLYAQKAGFTNAAALSASIPLMQVLPCYLREVFAVVYYFLFKSPHVGFLRNYVGLLAILGKR